MREATCSSTAALRATLAAREIMVDETELPVLRAIQRLLGPLKEAMAAEDLAYITPEQTPDFGREPRS